jgi:outer membrane protein assembly factor BamB
VLATAGGLVFAGAEEGNFFALDAATGEPRWQFQTGGGVRANPISFEIDGRQHIAVAAGNDSGLRALALLSTRSSSSAGAELFLESRDFSPEDSTSSREASPIVFIAVAIFLSTIPSRS